MNYKVINFDIKGDERGSLIAIEEGYNAPFAIKRVYYIFDTKQDVTRGYHAHKNLNQIAIAVKGSCTFILDNGSTKQEVTLDTPTKGLLLEGLLWREMKDFSSDCVLVVLASEHYDESDYIRDYDKFLKEVKNV
ncbi:MAG: FdtA/QdtA family cupin domain-containing protein [Candidatus Cloacimonetes bacterium]|nr:FdtA/QdtA family cupin domain-containing protein [Candidatus Cloacimonadota bacterium]